MSNAYPDTVRLYASDHPRLPHSLREKLAAHYEELQAQLIYSQDWADFRSRVGKMGGIRAAIDQCEELERELSK